LLCILSTYAKPCFNEIKHVKGEGVPTQGLVVYTQPLATLFRYQMEGKRRKLFSKKVDGSFFIFLNASSGLFSATGKSVFQPETWGIFQGKAPSGGAGSPPPRHLREALPVSEARLATSWGSLGEKWNDFKLLEDLRQLEHAIYTEL